MKETTISKADLERFLFYFDAVIVRLATHYPKTEGSTRGAIVSSKTIRSRAEILISLHHHFKNDTAYHLHQSQEDSLKTEFPVTLPGKSKVPFTTYWKGLVQMVQRELWVYHEELVKHPFLFNFDQKAVEEMLQLQQYYPLVPLVREHIRIEKRRYDQTIMPKIYPLTIPKPQTLATHFDNNVVYVKHMLQFCWYQEYGNIKLVTDQVLFRIFVAYVSQYSQSAHPKVIPKEISMKPEELEKNYPNSNFQINSGHGQQLKKITQSKRGEIALDSLLLRFMHRVLPTVSEIESIYKQNNSSKKLPLEETAKIIHLLTQQSSSMYAELIGFALYCAWLLGASAQKYVRKIARYPWLQPLMVNMMLLGYVALGLWILPFLHRIPDDEVKRKVTKDHLHDKINSLIEQNSMEQNLMVLNNIHGNNPLVLDSLFHPDFFTDFRPFHHFSMPKEWLPLVSYDQDTLFLTKNFKKPGVFQTSDTKAWFLSKNQQRISYSGHIHLYLYPYQDLQPLKDSIPAITMHLDIVNDTLPIYTIFNNLRALYSQEKIHHISGSYLIRIQAPKGEARINHQDINLFAINKHPRNKTYEFPSSKWVTFPAVAMIHIVDPLELAQWYSQP